MLIGPDYYNDPFGILTPANSGYPTLFSKIIRFSMLGVGVAGNTFIAEVTDFDFGNTKKFFLTSASIEVSVRDSVTAALLNAQDKIFRLYLNAATHAWPQRSPVAAGAVVVSQDDGYIINDQQAKLQFGGENYNNIPGLLLSINMFFTVAFLNPVNLDIYLSIDGLTYQS